VIFADFVRKLSFQNGKSNQMGRKKNIENKSKIQKSLGTDDIWAIKYPHKPAPKAGLGTLGARGVTNESTWEADGKPLDSHVRVGGDAAQLLFEGPAKNAEDMQFLDFQVFNEYKPHLSIILTK